MKTLHNGFMVVKTEIKISSLVQSLKVYKKNIHGKTFSSTIKYQGNNGIKKSVNILNKWIIKQEKTEFSRGWLYSSFHKSQDSLSL